MSIRSSDTASPSQVGARARRVGFVALVPSSSALQTKLDGQRRALEELALKGVIDSCAAVVVSRDAHGRDTFEFGGSQVTFSAGHGWSGKVNWLWGYSRFLRMIRKETTKLGLDTLYVRKFPVFDRRLVWTLSLLRNKGVRVLFEIPTYPYDAELTKPLISALDRDARRRLVSAVDRVVIVSGVEDEVFGVKAVCASNGVDLDSIGPAREEERKGAVDLVTVSSLEPWHRIDRVVLAVRDYWDAGGSEIRSLVIVGDGPSRNELEKLSSGETRIRFEGPLFGSQLDEQFTDRTIGVGNLEEHVTRGITTVQPLKHREYTARGVPFFYGLADPDFDSSSYALRVPDGTVDVDGILAWWNALDEGIEEIRADAQRLSWVGQMHKILEQVSDV